MPLISQEQVHSNAKLFVWKTEEVEDYFLSKLNLNALELSRLKTFSHIPRRIEWLAARLLVKEYLGNMARVEYTEDGKPLLIGMDGHISISHSGSLVGLLYSAVDMVGLDIERISSRPSKITKRFMKDEEVAFVEDDGSGKAITRAWCSKEALFKVLGDNHYALKEDFTLIANISAGSSSAAFYVRPFVGNQEVSFLDIEDYCIAYTVLHS